MATKTKIGLLAGAVALTAGACAALAPAEADPRDVPVTTTTIPVGWPDTPVGDDLVDLNEIQLVGSHNSYHIAPGAPAASFLAGIASAFPEIAAGLGNPAALNYTHASITQQLERGIRTFEFDIYADPDGGRFTAPALASVIGWSDPFLPDNLSQPGFKVIHIADLDWRTHCATLQECLGEIRAWSDVHPGHTPIMVMLEMKGGSLPEGLPATPILPFDTAMLDAVDAELNGAVGDRLITPDSVRGGAADLNTAITTAGWPSLAESRGKMLVAMDNADLRDEYLVGHAGLVGRAMFTSSGQGQPDGAVLKINDPGDGSAIASAVAQGYIVRTRADANPAPGAILDPARRDTALGSGAQMVHTDHPVGEPANNGYIADLGLPVQARCNPVNTTAATCSQTAVVEPN
ncbi:MAG: hypothetical protein GY812_14610 [Actinomycetia bacterium]|nr:hypothetical protein [Actinomycetes bacterium]